KTTLLHISCIKRYAMYLENIFIKRVRLSPHIGFVLTLRIFRKLLTKNLLRLNKSSMKKFGRIYQWTFNRCLKMKQKNSGLWHFLVRSTEIQYASYRLEIIVYNFAEVVTLLAVRKLVFLKLFLKRV